MDPLPISDNPAEYLGASCVDAPDTARPRVQTLAPLA